MARGSFVPDRNIPVNNFLFLCVTGRKAMLGAAYFAGQVARKTNSMKEPGAI